MINTTSNTFFHTLEGQIDIDKNGYVYVPINGPTFAYILKVSSDGVSTLFAGNTSKGGDVNGNALSTALFGSILGVRVDKYDNVFLADSDSASIKVVSNTSIVSEIAYTGDVMYDLAFDLAGNLFVPCFFFRILQKITPLGVKSTYAGTLNVRGFELGIPGKFSRLYGAVTDKCGNVFLADYGTYTILMVNSSRHVNLIAGTPDVYGNVNGPGNASTFSDVSYMAFDKFGDLYVTEYGGQIIRKITFS